MIQLEPIATKFIELEDGARYGMGENLYNRLVTLLKNDGRFIVVVREESLSNATRLLGQGSTRTSAAELEFDPSDRLHFNFSPYIAAEFSASVEGLNFLHGSRALRNFSGFKPDFRTPWNSGDFNSKNEFPPRSLEFQTSWFGTSFDPIGSPNDNTISGVDAGAEGEFNLIIAKVNYRRDSFLANANFQTRLHLVNERATRVLPINATGKGFLFALGVGYADLFVEFGVAKRDALKKTFDQGADLVVAAIRDELAKIPFRTRVEDIGAEGIVINAGRREGIAVGDRFLLEGGTSEYVVREAFHIGSIIEPVSGSGAIALGNVLVLRESDRLPPEAQLQVKTVRRNMGIGIAASVLRSEAELAPKQITFDPPEFSLPNGDAREALSLKNTILLPYLLWRYAQYDQEPKAAVAAPNRQNILAKSMRHWGQNQIRLAEAWQAHFSNQQGLGKGVRVAIIDSGIDYNDENLAYAAKRGRIGWDFFGDDARPFDDNSHGTALAGIIAAQGVGAKAVGIAPDAELLAYRVFDPYGTTRSMHLYGAFERAIQDGARVILAAWDTELDSQAIRAGIALAQKSGVLVIVAAGDRGRDLDQQLALPATLGLNDGVITVAAADQERKLVRLSGRFSNYGARTVELAAPGAFQEVLAPRGQTLSRAGSDLAAAYVAGAAALLFSVRPDWTATQVENALLRGAQIAPTLNGKVNQSRLLDVAGALSLAR